MENLDGTRERKRVGKEIHLVMITWAKMIHLYCIVLFRFKEMPPFMSTEHTPLGGVYGEVED
jgi:hypothetical protein